MNSIKIIFEDEYVLAIDKPSGITVNRADTTKNEATLQDWVENYLKIVPNGNSDFANRAGIVHRIDKETSGILLIGKTEESFINLQSQFKDRLIEKTYIALSHGEVYPSKGTISVPVGRLPWNRKRFGVLAGGKESVTQYELIKIYKLMKKSSAEPLSLLQLNPKTGRTHQIRVHLKYINHPIFSDLIYAGRKVSRDDRKLLGRLFLHAQKITFLHPVNKNKVELESKLPSELSNFLDSLQI